MLIPIVTLLVVIAILYGISLYTRILAKRSRTANAWGQVDNQLKHRHDLIRSLIVIVREELQQDNQVLEAATRARLDAIETGSDIPRRGEAESELSQATKRLLALIEGYPNLKNSFHVRALQNDLTTTEARIAEANVEYARCAHDYNPMLAGPLGRIYADRFQWHPAADFRLDATSELVSPWVLR
jgi:LemA protein